MDKQTASGNRPTLRGMALQHIIVFLICVVFPGLTTFVAPASWISFKRIKDEVHCTTRTCIFFVVPFKTQHVGPVTKITHRERAGGTRREQKHGRGTDKIIHIDGEGFLKIQGVGDAYAEVNVSPASLESVVRQSQDFLNSNQEGSKIIFTIANWKFGGLMGGVLTSFTALYVVGYTLGAIAGVFKFVKNLFRAPSYEDQPPYSSKEGRQ
jgi:hypothetical protein